MPATNYAKGRSPKLIENLSTQPSQRSFFKYVLGQEGRLGTAAGSQLPDHRSSTATPEPKPPGDDGVLLTVLRIDALLAGAELDKKLKVAEIAGPQVVLQEVTVEQPPRHLLTA